MPRPAITWLITDTHLFHEKMSKPEWGIRPIGFTQKIMDNLRYFVAKQDLLIHLGDVIFYQYTELKSMMDSVPCRKVLTMGNHDRKSVGWYLNNGFDFACESFVMDGVVFSHKPMEILPSGCKINIHGHFHNTDHRKNEPQYNSWYNHEIHRLLAIEYTDYKPVRLLDFLRKANEHPV